MTDFTLIIIFLLSTSLLHSDSCVTGECLNGKGSKIFSNGDKYEGDFKNGKLEGIGLFSSEKKDTQGILISSKIYEGHWKNNKKEGKGKLTVSKNGKTKTYSGDFLNGKLNGQGTLETDSATFHGRFKENRMNGQGQYTAKLGEKYLGEFLNHKFDGKGTYTFKDGSIYIGDFKSGKLHGKGRLFNSKHTLIKSGRWQNGEFIN